MLNDSINIVATGVPYGFQGEISEGRWLTKAHEREITAVSPHVNLIHVGRDELVRGNYPSVPVHVLLTETSGADPTMDVIPNIIPGSVLVPLITDELRWIQSCSSGVEHITPLLKSKAIILTNAAGVHKSAIAESVLLAMLQHAKRLYERRANQGNRRWEQLHCNELSNATVCILGTGNIGSQVARLASTLGMRILGINRSGREQEPFDVIGTPSSLSDFLPQIDYLVVACPLTKETTGMIGGPEFARLKSGAYIINVSRGRIVDEDALIEALESGALSGAFLDAFPQEPLSEDHVLWGFDRVTIIPHDSHASPFIGDKMVRLFADNLKRYIRGKDLRNVVDLEAGY